MLGFSRKVQMRQNGPINHELADCFLKVAHRRIGHETGYLDGDALAAPLGADGRALRPKVDEQPRPKR